MSEAGRQALGTRLAAAFEHTHMLVFHPRDAAAPALQALLDAGWSTTDIVTVSQLVSFLAYQIRVVAGLTGDVQRRAGDGVDHGLPSGQLCELGDHHCCFHTADDPAITQRTLPRWASCCSNLANRGRARILSKRP